MSATGDSEAGFTLLEMLTVIALTAMITAIAFPRLQQAVAATSLVRSRQAVLAVLTTARAQAIRTGTPTQITIGDDGRDVGWTGGAPRALAADARVVQLGAAPIAFFPDGSASRGALALWVGGRRAVLGVDAAGVVQASPPNGAAPTGATTNTSPAVATSDNAAEGGA